MAEKQNVEQQLQPQPEMEIVESNASSPLSSARSCISPPLSSTDVEGTENNALLSTPSAVPSEIKSDEKASSTQPATCRCPTEHLIAPCRCDSCERQLATPADSRCRYFNEFPDDMEARPLASATADHSALEPTTGPSDAQRTGNSIEHHSGDKLLSPLPDDVVASLLDGLDDEPRLEPKVIIEDNGDDDTDDLEGHEVDVEDNEHDNADDLEGLEVDAIVEIREIQPRGIQAKVRGTTQAIDDTWYPLSHGSFKNSLKALIEYYKSHPGTPMPAWLFDDIKEYYYPMEWPDWFANIQMG